MIGAAQIADGIEVPPIPRLLADHTTTEAAASLLAEQGGRLAIITAEGGIFDITAGRYLPKTSPNLDLWLKGHSGDPLRVDRRSRPPEHIPRPALTLGLMIQPAVRRRAGQVSFAASLSTRASRPRSDRAPDDLLTGPLLMRALLPTGPIDAKLARLTVETALEASTV